ncbi:hypothetical protein [Priestia megaterium]|uniref:hypothetical protein n=1 Tax=Priestia megaterium TaxID=1404 RepID=UPI003101800B
MQMQTTLEDFMQSEETLREQLKSLAYKDQPLHFINDLGQQLKFFYSADGSLDKKKFYYRACISEFDITHHNDLYAFGGTIFTSNLDWLERVYNNFMAGGYNPNYDFQVNMSLPKNENYVLKNV